MKEGKLIVCATPIGNLEDASPRLARALAEADLVACEDTRQTRKLLTHLGVTTRMTSYHEVGEKERAAELAERVAAGLRLALVTDAGMPAVSDPGYHLIGACLERGVPVEVARVEAGGGPGGAVHVRHRAAAPTDEMVVVVPDPELVAGGGPGGLDAAHDAPLGQGVQHVVDGLVGHLADIGTDGGEDGLSAGVRAVPAGHGLRRRGFG